MDDKEFAAEKARRRKAGLGLIGKTFTRKEELKEAGCVWDPESHQWLLPDIQTAMALGAVPVPACWRLPDQPSTDPKPQE